MDVAASSCMGEPVVVALKHCSFFFYFVVVLLDHFA
jgi:hypothetical protein